MIIFRRIGTQRKEPTDLHQTVLITGASSGIGKVTALYLAEKGYRVIGTSRSIERLEGLQSDATNRSLSITAIEMDINSNEGVARVLPKLLADVGGIDVLVNNAGYSLWGPLETVSMREIKAQFETNVFAALRLTQAVLPYMMEKGRGKIINVSSVLGRMGTPFNGAYASSKFALEGLSESLRSELWPFGVRVSIVEPGLFSTDFQKNQVISEGTKVEDSHYSQYIENYIGHHHKFDRFASDPVQVAKVIHKILRLRNPSFRYPVGVEARAGMIGARLIPEKLFQSMVRRATM